MSQDIAKPAKPYFKEINIMRALAVICVVIGHSFSATSSPTVLGFIKSFVYCFHMPAFFFISGFLMKEKSIGKSDRFSKIKTKFIRLMVPYLFLTLVTVALKMVFGAFANNPLNYKTVLFDVLIGRNNPNGGLWFLYALFVISAIGILLNNIDSRIMFGVTFALSILNHLFFHQNGHILAFILTYAWFFYGGMMFRTYFYDKLKNSKLINTIFGRIITAIISVAFLAVAYIKIYLYDFWLLSMFTASVGILLLYVISSQITAMKKDNKIIMSVGKYGMDIYMIGYYVQQSIFVVMGKMLGINYYIYAWCMCILGLILPIVISKYIVRKSRVLSFLILGQQKVRK